MADQINWENRLSKSLKLAKENKKSVLIDFTSQHEAHATGWKQLRFSRITFRSCGVFRCFYISLIQKHL